MESDTDEEYWGWVVPPGDDAVKLASWVAAARAATDARPCCRRRRRPPLPLPSSAVVPSTWSVLEDDEASCWLPGTRPPPKRQQITSAVHRNIATGVGRTELWPHVPLWPRIWTSPPGRFLSSRTFPLSLPPGWPYLNVKDLLIISI